ncbi:centromere protein J [Spea bombifrons]|uniref:centromere protein J n=1 Tax=Spea bombifrons TaxID=233779 RepID=UPI00234A26EA|nr:centromere protein J [Spea bombifrons]
MPEMPSSNFPGETNFMAQYIPSLSRSGVILNPTFPIFEPDRDFQMLNPCRASGGFNMTHHAESGIGVLSEDSLEEDPYDETLATDSRMSDFSVDDKGEMFGFKGSVCNHEVVQSSRSTEDVINTSLNNPLLRKLEQLKELQQQKQEQLKQQQMEQLQRLMEEQKMLLSLVANRPACIEPDPPIHPSDSAAPHHSPVNSPVSHNIPRSYPYSRSDVINSSIMSFKNQPNGLWAQEICSGASLREDCFVDEQEQGHCSGETDIFDDLKENSETSLQVEQECLSKQKDETNEELAFTEERPILSEIKERKKSFEEFLEEQMRLEEQRLKQIDHQVPKDEEKPVLKRPFLRRGEGLARFRSGNPKVSKPKENDFAQLKISEAASSDKTLKLHMQRKVAPVTKEQTSENNMVGSKKLNQTSKGNTELLQKKLVLKNHNIKNHPSVIQGQQESKSSWTGKSSMKRDKLNILEANKENMENQPPVEANALRSRLGSHENQKNSTRANEKPPSDTTHSELSFEVSFQKRQANWEKEKQKENFELDEFLLLEQAAEEISFSSNSSFVQKLLDPNYAIDNGHGRHSSTPVKVQQVKTVSRDEDAKDGKLDRIQGKNDAKTVLKNNVALTAVVPHKQCEEVEVIHTANQEIKKTNFTEPVRMSCENEDDPLSDDFKDLCKNTKNNNSRDFDLDLSNGEDSDDDESTLLENKSNHFQADGPCSSSSDTSQIEFDDERTWADLEDLKNQENFPEQNFPRKEFVPSEYTTSPTYVQDKTIKRKVASKKGDDHLKAEVTVCSQSPPPTSDLMMKLFPSLKPKSKSQPACKSTPVQENADPTHSRLLREKLIELENEIERFKMENASLTRLHEEKEKAMEALRKEAADFEQQKAKELARIEEFKKEEIKKLQKERKVFEKYASAARAIPDKREREEIQLLKQQVKDLQEELKRKEAKWSTTHGRLRNQIETLSKENGELREEIKFMEKVRVDAWKKAEVAESKKKTVENQASVQRPSESTSPLITEKNRSPPSFPQPDSMRITPGNQAPIKGKAPKHDKPSPVCDKTKPKTKECSDMPERNEVPATKGQAEDEVQGEISYPDGKIERILRNGCHVILFPNGTRKEVSADGKSTTVTFFNGDVKQVLSDQRVIYYYAEAQTTHTTYPDGIEILQFPNGQIEKHFPDGKKEITFPDQTIKNLHTDGTEESIFPDGTIITIQPDGTKIIVFDNGQHELHTPQFKRREYPDGTVKTVYSNGQQETKYASGRVRVKDKDGNVLMDAKM